jgi:hypothetical protein
MVAALVLDSGPINGSRVWARDVFEENADFFDFRAAGNLSFTLCSASIA